MNEPNGQKPVKRVPEIDLSADEEAAMDAAWAKLTVKWQAEKDAAKAGKESGTTVPKSPPDK